ncbi:DUF5937 family protein [Streptomyces platensis]|nr:DUF5937 family protein [Streptomyces platensis]
MRGVGAGGALFSPSPRAGLCAALHALAEPGHHPGPHG